MILYHGSNVSVQEPRLLTFQRNLDFGKGFYTTSDLHQAEIWARRKTLLRAKGSAMVSCYAIDEKRLEGLRLLRFSKPDETWLNYITAYRRGTPIADDYDVVIGPVADDQTTQTLTLYLDGYLDASTAIARLLTQRLKDQYTFRTEAGLKLLRCIEVKAV